MRRARATQMDVEWWRLGRGCVLARVCSAHGRAHATHVLRGAAAREVRVSTARGELTSNSADSDETRAILPALARRGRTAMRRGFALCAVSEPRAYSGSGAAAHDARGGAMPLQMQLAANEEEEAPRPVSGGSASDARPHDAWCPADYAWDADELVRARASRCALAPHAREDILHCQRMPVCLRNRPPCAAAAAPGGRAGRAARQAQAPPRARVRQPAAAAGVRGALTQRECGAAPPCVAPQHNTTRMRSRSAAGAPGARVRAGAVG
jgi:hypothetical protein